MQHTCVIFYQSLFRVYTAYIQYKIVFFRHLLCLMVINSLICRYPTVPRIICVTNSGFDQQEEADDPNLSVNEDSECQLRQ